MYDHRQLEEKWLQFWEEKHLFQDTAHFDTTVGKKAVFSRSDDEFQSAAKLYLLIAFAYPSAAGLHVGHVESMTALDILARYYRMNGKQVFFPVGWDAFGLPAENFAIKTGVPPAQTTKDAIVTFRRQLKRVAISYDWENEIATSHPGYYRWTQWLFLRLFEKGKAYQGTGMVNWCSSCQTVLANEQVVAGECERCSNSVIQKEMKQWFFKITDYKDELISGLSQVDWPAATKQQQINWIGKSEGVRVQFALSGHPEVQVPCFTTRIDTICGVTFLAVSPEKSRQWGLFDLIPQDNRPAVQAYLDQAGAKTEEQRKVGEKDKTGVDTQLCAINPVNNEEIPIYVTDYVLGGYGTGAVMGVPAHDERDLAFAAKHALLVKPVIQSSVAPDQQTHHDLGILINSGSFDGLTSMEAMTAIPGAHPERMEPTTTYKLRDWLISRQRYWGAPIPIVYDPQGQPHPVKEEHLPWLLPTDVDFKPTGESPLKSSKEFIERTERLYGEGWRPEFDTMDTFVDSSWYYLRYVSSRDEAAFANPEQLRDWLPVDFYMIGPEHIVLHLLYSRFFTKFLRDEGYLQFDEPFLKMRHQGMILGPDGKKMSKSKGNVINPDEVVEKFGADCLRLYEMFMGPIEADKPWSTTSMMGVYRFLQRLQSTFDEELSAVGELVATGTVFSGLQQKLHSTLEKLTTDLPLLKINTAIASLMEFLNTWEVERRKAAGARLFADSDLSVIARMIAPLAPFLAEEMWSHVPGAVDSVHQAPWPHFDKMLAKPTSVVIPVQINGKVRAKLTVAQDQLIEHASILEQALAHPDVRKYTEGKTITKQLYIAGKIVSLAVN